MFLGISPKMVRRAFAGILAVGFLSLSPVASATAMHSSAPAAQSSVAVKQVVVQAVQTSFVAAMASQPSYVTKLLTDTNKCNDYYGVHRYHHVRYGQYVTNSYTIPGTNWRCIRHFRRDHRRFGSDVSRRVVFGDSRYGSGSYVVRHFHDIKSFSQITTTAHTRETIYGIYSGRHGVRDYKGTFTLAA